MSSLTDQEVEVRNGILLHVTVLISFTVLLFDHLLTLSSEIEHIWGKRLTPFSVLFLLNRYFASSTMLAYVALNLSPLGSCDAVCTLSSARLLLAFSVVTVLIAEVMLAMRVYAVYQNNKLILGLLSSVWVVHLVLMLWLFKREGGASHVALRFKYCNPLTPKCEDHTSLGSGMLFVIPAIVFDTIVGGLLSLGLYRKSGSYRKHMPLIRLIIRDGSLYFAVVFITNVVWILVQVLEHRNPLLAPLEFMPLEIWSGCITTTMIGRLTLNLRMYQPEANNELTSQVMTIKFRNARERTSVIDLDHNVGKDAEK